VESARAEPDLVVVRTFLNRFEADVAKSALDAADIESLVRPDDAGGMQPGMWMGQPVELVVTADDAERAQEVLESSARPEPERRN
jgi:hypothetical protein